MIPAELEYSLIKNIHEKLSPYVLKTPIIKNPLYLNEFFNTNLYLKLELFQNSGCFKVRGAINNILNLSKEQKSAGVTAVSAGNHAIATSYASNLFSIKNKIFMYKLANKYRLNKVKSLNANLFLTDPVNAFKNAEEASNEGYFFMHPFDGKFMIQGNATLGFEITQQINDLDYVLVSVGGGGLISGVGSIIRQKFPKCKIIGIEPLKSNGMTESLKKGFPLKKVKMDSIADSLSPPLHMEYSFNICKNVIDEIVNVTDQEIVEAMKFAYNHYKFILEPACAAGLAALDGPLKNTLKNKKTLLILCGSNIDLSTWIKNTS